MSRRRYFAVLTVVAATLLAGGAEATAATPTATPTNSAGKTAPPAGLNILYSGDSWHRLMPVMMPEIAKAAGITGQRVDWNSVTEKMRALLESGNIDILSWGRPSWSENLGWLEREKIIESGLKGNPNFRLYPQMAWAVHDGQGNKIATTADYDHSNIADVQAVIDVNMGNTPWPHLLVYDRQNKRLSVSKHAQGK